MRVLIALLLAANVVFFVWSQGWVDDIAGVRAMGDREPERLERQVHPETIRILTPQGPAVAASGADKRLACLEAGPFGDAEASAAEAALATVLPAGSWQRVKPERGAPVVDVGKPGSGQVIRIVSADAEFAAKVSGLKLDALGSGFGSCAR